MKSKQLFTDEYLNECKKMSSTQIAQFLEDFRLSQAPVSSKSKLISIKVPEDLLEAFREKCKEDGVKYQSKIKDLMRDWILSQDT
jgi:uncharacterized protein (DUF4415 family)